MAVDFLQSCGWKWGNVFCNIGYILFRV